MAYKAYLAGWYPFTSRVPIGTNVYEREWDALLLLDTCRVDALRAVADEYDFLGAVESMVSVGSTSSEWIANTFRERYRPEIAETAYLSANAFSKRVIEDRDFPGDRLPVAWTTVDATAFGLLDNAWRYQPETPYKHMLAEHLTDRAIAVGRDRDPGRLIVHYSQPHAPYIAAARAANRDLEPHERDPFEELRAGRVDRETVWNAYLDNLRMALDSVAVLLRNLDAETVAISADHGEAFGSWGAYNHPAGSLHPHVKRVPWATTTATDEGGHEPKIDRPEPQRDVESHLDALGYR
ncbi:hypothetical protein GJ629_01835 [Halapricum sp. CBA1109]|nr:hypothetical protein [Halapricum sp. CBA1109]